MEIPLGYSNERTNVSLLTLGNGETSLVNDLGTTNVDAERSSQKDSSDYSSMHMLRAAFSDLMEEARIQLIDDMEKRLENGRKETKDMIEGIRKEMDENVKDLFKTVQGEQGTIGKEPKPQTRKVRGKIDRTRNRTKHE